MTFHILWEETVICPRKQQGDIFFHETKGLGDFALDQAADIVDGFELTRFSSRGFAH